MTRLMTFLRLPLFLLGLGLLFVADRYLGNETYHFGLRIGAFVLCAASLLCTIMLSVQAGGKGFAGEAKSWRQAAFWQTGVLVGLGLYMAYVKALGDAPMPETASAKILLGAWLVCLTLGLFAGLGFEWAMRDAGRGANAEPARVTRAGLSMLGVGMFFSFLVAVNYVGDKKDITRDWSYLKVRTPSDSTKAMLKTVTGDMTIALFYPNGNEVRTLLKDYFDQIAAAEPRIKVEYYDKDMQPTQAETYRVARNGQIVFDLGGKKSRIDTGTTVSKARKTLKELDQEFQKAFLEISSDRKTLYFTRGHGESSWVGDVAENQLKSLKMIEGFLRSQNYSTRLFGIAEGSATAVPDDASAVVIVGPTEPFQAEEVAALRAYVEGGGNLMVFLDTEASTSTSSSGSLTGGGDQPLFALLNEMGIRFNQVPLGNEKNHVAATRSQSDVWFIFSNVFTSHDSVVSLARHDERVAVLVFQGGYLTVTPDTPKFKAFETVRALSDTFVDQNRNFKADADEKRDSYVLGAVAELKGVKPADKKSAKNGRVVVFSDATSLADAIVRNVGNALYFADSLKWMVGESEMAGAIATEEDVKIRHTNKEDAVWFHGTVIVVPLMVLGAGFFATRRRRGGKEKGGADAA